MRLWAIKSNLYQQYVDKAYGLSDLSSFTMLFNKKESALREIRGGAPYYYDRPIAVTKVTLNALASEQGCHPWDLNVSESLMRSTANELDLEIVPINLSESKAKKG